MKYLILISLWLSCLSAHAQYVSFRDLEKNKETEAGHIVIDLSENDVLPYVTKSDTTHYYVEFENDFNDSEVRVYCNDSLIYKGKITSNQSIDLAKTIKVGAVDKVKKISIGLEDLPLITIFPIKGKYYIRINYTGYPLLHFRFSKYAVRRR